jgi:peptidoglycan/xylan/chitin deacetylase (PgdA/CDA1 family)
MPVIPLLFHDVYAHDPCESGFGSPAANRYKLTTGVFDGQLACLARARQVSPIDPGDLVDPGIGDGSRFAITVDDGGRSYYTHVADRLEAEGWVGACFVPTDFIGQRGFLEAGQLRELDARGHVIGSHSASHPTRFSALDMDAMRGEWSRSLKALEDILGHAVTSASIPGGYFSLNVVRAAADSGIRLLYTSEPVLTRRALYGCTVAGRFTLRAGCRPGLAGALVSASPWARRAAWASWNAKAVVKPLLGSSYPRVADWLVAARSFGR